MASLALLAVLESQAIACATCSLDAGGAGQTLMLVCMICVPLTIAAIGFAVIRQLVTKARAQ